MNETYGGVENIPEEVLKEEFSGEYESLGMSLLIVFVIFYLGFIFLYGVPSILFGIGLLKLRGKVENAHVTGILNIVGGATVFIFIGFLVLAVAYIFEIIL